MHRNFFYRNSLCLKVFEVNLKLCHYNLFPGPGTNQKWFKYGFHRHMDWDGLERHIAAIWVKLYQKLCRKENFDGKWRMTAYNWQKVKLLYHSSIKKAFQCFLQLCDMCFSSWDIIFFVASVFSQSISEKIEKKCVDSCYGWQWHILAKKHHTK